MNTKVAGGEPGSVGSQADPQRSGFVGSDSVFFLPPVYTVVQEEFRRGIGAGQRAHQVLEPRFQIQQAIGPGDEVSKDTGFRGFPGVYRFLRMVGGVLKGLHPIDPKGTGEGGFIGAGEIPQSREIDVVEDGKVPTLQ